METPTDLQPTENMAALKQAVKGSKAGSGSVKTAIQSAGFYITGRQFTRLIRMCRNTKQWEKALDILEAVRSCDPSMGEPASFYTFSAAISVCSKSGRVTETLWVLREMKASAAKDPAISPDSSVYRMVILCCARQKETAAVVEMLEEVLHCGLGLDVDTLKVLLAYMLYNRLWEHVVNVLDEVHRQDEVLEMDSYNEVLKACAGAGNLDAATDVLLMMQMAGLDPDSSSCHHVMHAVKMSDMPEVGLELLQDMYDCGIPVYPETYAYLLQMGLATENAGILQGLLDVIGDPSCTLREKTRSSDGAQNEGREAKSSSEELSW